MQRTMTPILDGTAVTEALRRAHARGDTETMRRICGSTPDDVLTMIGNGDLEIRGDSRTRFMVTTTDDSAAEFAERWGTLNETERQFFLGWVHSEIKRIDSEHDSFEPAEEQWAPALAEKLGMDLDEPLGAMIDEALEMFG